MSGKIVETRFTIQFSRTDPSHLQVVEILNRQGRRSKAQYIVNAVLHYKNCGETTNMQRTAELEKIIEVVVNRILRDREESNKDKINDETTPGKLKKQSPVTEEISFDDALESLGKNGFNVVADALDMFRKK
ncbi:MAG: hypothetical protein FWD71_04930 [Oscillospiraceae bacterium]|nr:hypothetical protein [Oscillospiraceae bacterium]